MGTLVARLRALGWKRWLSATVVLLVVVGGLGAWLLTRSGGGAEAQTTTATVSSGTIKQTVSASGTIEAKHTADLDFAVSGTVTKVYVKAGDTVSKGQALAKVADGALVATRGAAAASVTAAQEQLVDDEDADASDVQLAADRTAVLSAQATLKSAREDVDDAVLRATVAGTVTAVNIAKGDVVGGSSSGSSSGTSSASGATGATGASSASSTSSTSSSAVEIVSTNRFIVDATVSADDVKQLKKGLQAEITVTGVDDTVYGTVASIGLVAQTSSSGAAVFPVTIDVTGTRNDLYAGTSATASIIVKQTTGVLSVASSAIHTDSDGSTYVEKVVDGNAVKTPVEIGTVYGATTQIVSGLSEGDQVQVQGFTRTGGGGQQGGQTGEGGFPAGGSFTGGGSMPGGMPGGAGFGG